MKISPLQSSFQKLTLLLIIMMGSAQLLSAQGSYTLKHVSSNANPKSLNTDADASLTSWTAITLGTQSQNSWSDTVPIPFSFEFYGGKVTHIRASQNGLVTFKINPSKLPFTNNMNLPSDSLPDSTIAVFWDEFTSRPSTGSNDRIYVKTFGTAPNRHFYIRWHSFEMGDYSSYNYFAVALEESTNKIYVVDQSYYSARLSMTIGVQLNNTTAVQYGDSTQTWQNTSSSSNTNNTYYEFAPLAPNNMSLASIDGPVSNCGLGSQKIAITVANNSAVSEDSIPIAYQVNNGTVVRDTIFSTLKSLDSTSFSFSTSYNFSTVGAYDLKVWTEFPNDPNSVDDTIAVNVVNISTVSTYPYSVDWESGKAGWFTTFNDGPDQWELGSPAQTTINSARGGNNAWMTGLDSNYRDSLDIMLNSPCFDFSKLNNPTLAFWLYFDTEADWDGMVLERSLDKGASWRRVDSVNRYLYNNVSTNLPLSAPMWSGTNSGWTRYSLIDSAAAKESSVRYRFRFVADESNREEGVAIDDFSAFEAPSRDFGVTQIIGPSNNSCGTGTTVPVVIIKNYGVAAQDSIPVSVALSGDFIGRTLVDTFFGSLAIGQEDTLVFRSSFNSLSGGALNISASTAMSGDIITSNDKSSVALTIGTTPNGPSTIGATRCGPGSLELIASSSVGNVIWYDSIAGGRIVGRGDTLNVTLASTTTYYAEVSEAPAFPIRITEVDQGTPDFVEIQNLSSTDFDASGYQVITSDSYTDIDDVNSTAWSLGKFTGLEVQYKTDNASINYWGSNLFYNSGSPGWVMIIDGSGNVMDYMAWGWTATDISGQSVSFGGNTYSPGQEWSGAGINATCSNTLNRQGSSDNNSSSDWTCITVSRGTMNTGLSSLNGCPSPRVAATAKVDPVASGMTVVNGTVFGGTVGNGTLSSPDTVCVRDTLTYEITPPIGFSNSDFGTGWTISSIVAEDFFGNSPNKATVNTPTSTSNATYELIATGKDAGSLFTITATANLIGSTCDTTLTKYVYVMPLPQASFTVSDVCQDDVASFTNGSSVSGGHSIRYSWDFGDNSNSKIENPSHIYITAGTYTVMLTATSTGGCVATATDDIDIFDLPEAKFGIANACDGDDVVFSDASTIATGAITGYSWDFGDSTSSNRKKASHTYSDIGTYTVTLTVTSNRGCESSTSGQASVFGVPVADYSFGNGCVSDTFNFFNNTAYSGNGTVSYAWDFTDGTGALIENPRHIFNSYGSYLVKMIASSSEGCVDSVTKLVQAYADPVAAFGVADQCYGDTTQFTNMSTINGGIIASYSWNVHGDISTGVDASKAFGAAGQYAVSLTATTEDGCENTIGQTVDIHPTPITSFSVADTCAGENIRLTDGTSTGSDTLEYAWSFSDGSSSTDALPAKAFANAGSYKVTLTTVTENSCTSSSEQQVEVFALPDASFDYGHMGNALYNFTATDDNLVSYSWNFGDGNTSDESAPKHQFDTEGQYDVTLTTVNTNGCSSTSTISLDVSTGIGVIKGLAGMTVFPNPYVEATTISYQLDQPANVILEIYDIHGRLVQSLAQQEQNVGEYDYNFAGETPSGVYFVKLQVNDQLQVARLVKTN